MSPPTLDYVTGAEKKDTSENTVTQMSIVSFVNHTHIKCQFADCTQTL